MMVIPTVPPTIMPRINAIQLIAHLLTSIIGKTAKNFRVISLKPAAKIS
jgi:hypothetical protein